MFMFLSHKFDILLLIFVGSLLFFLIVSIFLIIVHFFNLIKKYITLVNLTTGIICLIIFSLFKQLSIIKYILHFLNLENLMSLEFIIISSFALITKLGIKGLIGDTFKNVFPIYLNMTSGENNSGDVNSIEDKNSLDTKYKSGGSLDSNSSDSTIKKEESDSKGKTPEEGNVSTTADKNVHRSNYAAKRYVELWNKQINDLNSQIKVISAEIINCKDEELRAFKEEDLADLFEQLSMFSKESVTETRKIMDAESSNNSNKRTGDLPGDDNSSKKNLNAHYLTQLLTIEVVGAY